MKPVAEDDFTAVLSGTIIDLEFDMIGFILSNDYDVDGPVYLYDVEEPYYGAIKYSLDGPVYVAPHNFDGVDFFRYIITDGQLTDTATVYISVANNPHFPTGSDQQYVFLEDEDLTLSTVRMAAGVGGQDADLFVWANPMHESVMINHDSDNHTVTFSAADNFFGQTEAMFYVGHEGEPMDSMMVSIVITPVNDAPVAEFLRISMDQQSLSLICLAMLLTCRLAELLLGNGISVTELPALIKTQRTITVPQVTSPLR